MDFSDLPIEVQAGDQWCRRQMIYWAEQVQRPEAVGVADGSILIPPGPAPRVDPQPIEMDLGALAWRSIASAGEHAGLAIWAHQTAHGWVLPRPQLTLTRAVLLAASRAVYLLEPEEEHRRLVRVCELANTEARDALKFIDAEAEALGDDHPSTTTGRRYFEDLRETVGDTLESLGYKRERKTNELTMLEAVAPILADGADLPRAAIASLWSKSSAAAHGRSWVWTPLSTDSHAAEDFVEIWSFPLGMLGHAWRLWNLRRGRDSPAAYAPDDWRPDPKFAMPQSRDARRRRWFSR